MIKTLEEDSEDNKPQMMILVAMRLLVTKQLSVKWMNWSFYL